ncbi:MAG: RsmB/NOP family class I SAM-dependent RNA methyltransferase [Epsilonproteobacteria bacterium]|nr:RsmB/NOP family class I SAM-dependent RNA methyltransferase [Campylobacterota bacterium]
MKNKELLDIFLERVKKIDSILLEEILKPKSEFGFRVNLLRGDIKSTIDLLKKEGFNPKRVEFLENGYTLPIEDRKKIIKSTPYTQNLIYIQSLSSIYAAEALDVRSSDWVLDLAAAPGGKSLIFSEKAKKVSAVEPDKKRFFRMKRNFKEHMAKNIQTYNKDGRFIYKSCPAWFDKVFLDAPCSSEAHIDLKEGITWWNLKRVKRFSKLQKELIISAFESLKSGGEMIYATCTYSPEENEEVVDFLLKKYENATLEELSKPNRFFKDGLLEWEDKSFDHRVSKSLRIYPNGGFDGFFMAKIKKL